MYQYASMSNFTVIRRHLEDVKIENVQFCTDEQR